MCHVCMLRFTEPSANAMAELAAHVRRTRSAPLGKPGSRELEARSAASPEGEPLAPLSRCRSGFRESGSSVCCLWTQRARGKRM